MKNILPQTPSLSPEQRVLFNLRLKNKRQRVSQKTIIPRHSQCDFYPLSFQQEQLWFLQWLNPESPVYNLHHTYALQGPLNLKAMQRSFDEIVRRHEILRTSFVVKGGEGAQQVSPLWEDTLSIMDLRHLPEAEREEYIHDLTVEQAHRPADLARDKLLRAVLLRLSENSHLLLLTLHHIVTDWWSFKVLSQELSVLYNALSEDRPSPLGDLPIQYGDFALWQREWLQGERLETLLSYWRRRLAGAPRLLSLPTDYPRPHVQTQHGAREEFILPVGLFESFCNLGRQEGGTAFTVLLAAFQTFLYRYTGQKDILVGTPIANRIKAETEPLIGFFLNTIVMRADFSNNPSFRELLSLLRKEVMGAQAYQEIPFRTLVQALEPDRNPSFTPLFQVAFIYLSSQAPTFEHINSGKEVMQLQGLSVEVVKTPYRMSEFDLTLCFEEKADGLHGFMEYSTDLFKQSSIRRMIEHLQRLMEGIVAAPDSTVSELPMLTESERHQLLARPNNTAAGYPQDRCVHQLFEEQVARTPHAVAVIEGERHLTYSELNARADQLARHLQAHGAGPDVLVGLCVERSIEMLLGLLGVLKAGAAYVPLDPSNPRERLAFILRDAAVPLLLSTLRVRSLPAHDAEVIYLDSDWQQIARGSSKPLLAQARPGNLAYVIYTSGSTGRPKGTLITHEALVNYLSWCRQAYAAEQGQGTLVHTSISFDMTVTGLIAPLLVGGKLELLPEGPGVEVLLTTLKSSRDLSFVKLTPTQLDMLGQRLTAEEAAGCTRAFIIGGENLQAATLRFWQQAAPETKLINEYGPTETAVGCCVYEAIGGQHATGSVPIGRPIANTQLYLLDDLLRLAPVGIQSELYIGGASLARGYLNLPNLTAEKFIPNPFSEEPGARLYRTGDLARYLADGNIEFLGRADWQVKIRGYRIEPGEVETTLNKHRLVSQSVVIKRGDDERLVAYLVANPGALTPSIEELRHHLAEQLPDYMIPAAFVVMKKLPLMPNGKVDRHALPPPEDGRPQLATQYIAPRDELEQFIATIWQDVLRIESVGINDNFFDVGGHSLLLLQVHSKLAGELACELTAMDMFVNPTIRTLAEHLMSLRPEAKELKTRYEGSKTLVQKRRRLLKNRH